MLYSKSPLSFAASTVMMPLVPLQSVMFWVNTLSITGSLPPSRVILPPLVTQVTSVLRTRTVYVPPPRPVKSPVGW